MAQQPASEEKKQDPKNDRAEQLKYVWLSSVFYLNGDTNRDGKLSKDEFTSVLDQLDVPLDDKKQFFNVLDTNKDNSISYDEFVTVFKQYKDKEDKTSVFAAGKWISSVYQRFENCDKDSDGKITFSEWQDAFKGTESKDKSKSMWDEATKIGFKKTGNDNNDKDKKEKEEKEDK